MNWAVKSIGDVITAVRLRSLEQVAGTADDDEHTDGALAIAAAVRAALSVLTPVERQHIRASKELRLPHSAGLTYSRAAIQIAHWWPFADHEPIPSETSRRDLVSAAALIIAEIERIDRLAAEP